MKDAVRIFKTLSDSTRLRIILLLLRQELCVCELTFILDQGQSRVSHHLRILRDSGLVEDVREGKWIIYRIPSKLQRWRFSWPAGVLSAKHAGHPERHGDKKNTRLYFAGCSDADYHRHSFWQFFLRNCHVS